MIRTLLHASLFVIAAVSASSVLAAADYPANPVRTIVPYAPGGASDVLARIVSREMKTNLGQVAIIENHPGGGALIGTSMVANAPPNGYVVGVMDSAFVINPALVGSKLPYDTVKDFKPVILLAQIPIILAVRKDVPAQTLPELVALAKAKPGVLNYSSAGNGSPLHLAGEQFKHAAGVDIVHVPYKGGAPSVQAIVAGETQVTMTVLSTSLAYIRSGQLKALAVSGTTRLPELPDVPTFAEAGYGAVDSLVSFGVIAPKNTPDDVITKLSAAYNKALQTDATREQLITLGFQPIGGDPKFYADFIGKEIAKWIDFARIVSIKID